MDFTKIRDLEHARIDLHMHSIYSDGVKTPAELIAMRKEEGCELLAVTDHDGTGGVRLAIEAGKDSGITVLSGIELGTLLDHRFELHILGYDFDIDNPVLTEAIESIRAFREKRNSRLLEYFQKEGIPLTWDELHDYPDQDYIGKPNFAVALERRGYVKSVQEAFDSPKYLASETALSLKKMAVDPYDAIAWITEAGGKAVWAHPMETKYRRPHSSAAHHTLIRHIARRLAAHGLQGIECWHPSATRQDSLWLETLADDLGLFKTKGSDYHGLK